MDERPQDATRNPEGFPESLVDRLEQLGVRKGDVVLSTVADLDMAGHPMTVWVAVTKDRIVSVSGDDGEESVDLEMKRIEAVRIRCRVGSAFLQARVEGGYFIDIVRFTNIQRYRFERFAQEVENLRLGRPVDPSSPLRPNPVVCAVCGLPLQSPGAACPRCLNQEAILFRVLSLVLPHMGWILVILVVMFLSVTLSLIPPHLTKIMVDEVLTSKRHVEWLAWIVAALVGAELLRAQLNMVVGTLSTAVGTLITFDVRNRLFVKLQELSVDYYDRNSIGTLMTRFSSDVEAFYGFVSQAGQGFLLNIFLIIGIGAMLFSINAVLALYVLIPIPLVVFGTIFFWQRIYPRYYKLWDSQSKMNTFLNSTLSGIRLVRAFAQENREIGRFGDRSAYLRDSQRSVNLSVAAFNPAMTFLFGVGGLIVWYAGGRHVLAGRLSLGQLMAFLSYIGMFYTPLSNLALMSNWFSSFTTASNRIFEVLDTEPTFKDVPKPIRLDAVAGDIEFDRVTFGYDPYFPVLKNVSLAVKAGQLVGIVGKSGSGKTTIINLVCRFYDAQRGTIRIDGKDIREVSSSDLRRHIGLVLQETFMFRGTIAENLAYGKPDASFKEIIDAAKAAHAHEFIMKLPAAYDFLLGERGAGLSGGEKQRIGIARALLCNPPILILDEATSSVDTETEQKIQDALGVLCKGRTTIAIAHRLSTLRGADRIYVVDDGRIAEFGTHAELLEKKGTYFRLVEMQTKLSSIETAAGS